MAKLQIQIKPDRADLNYQAGQSLKAVITLYSAEKITIEKLNVSVFRNKTDRQYLSPTGTIQSGVVLEAKVSKKFTFEYLIPNYLEGLPDSLLLEVRAEIEEDSARTILLEVNVGAQAKTVASTAWDVVVAFGFSSIFLGLAGLGLGLWLNGFAGKEIPYGVQWFGFVCVIGGMYVAQKVLVGMNMVPQFFIGGVYLVMAALGYYICMINPEFILTDPEFSTSGAPHSLLKMARLLSDSDWRAAHAFLLAIASGLLAADAFATRGKKQGYYEFMITIPLLAVGLIAGMCVWGLAGAHDSIGSWGLNKEEQLGETTTLFLYLGVSVLCLIMASVGFFRPSWQNTHRYIVLAGAAPLLLLGIMESLSGGEFSGFPPMNSRILALLLVVSSVTIFYFGNRNLFAEIWLGNVKLIWGTKVYAPGAPIVASLEFTPKREAKVNRIRTRLLCYENVQYLFGNERRYQTNTLLDRTNDFPINQTIEAGKPFTHTIETSLPLGLPESSNFSSRTVWWEFDLVLMVDGAPDWSSRETIEVKMT
jgi:hypothetical protein